VARRYISVVEIRDGDKRNCELRVGILLVSQIDTGTPHTHTHARTHTKTWTLLPVSFAVTPYSRDGDSDSGQDRTGQGRAGQSRASRW
jgi:hypothetical protein